MPTVSVSAFGAKPQFFDAAGNPDVSYKLFMYAAGSTSTKQNSYTNSNGSVANTNPIILNSLGQTPNELWWDISLLYKVVLAPATDTDPPTNPIWTVDNLAPMNSSNGGQSVTEWILYSGGPTYVSANSFTVSGNQTQTFHIGRRVQLTTTGGMVYGRITNSVFASQTTVTLQMDGTQILDSSLSAAYYSILTNDVLALPERIGATSGTNNYTVSVGAARLVIGDEYKINFVIANTSAVAPTLSVDGSSVLPILTQNGVVPLPGMLSGQQKIRYDGTEFIILNPINLLGRNFIDGFISSTAGSSATMSIGAGQCSDSTNSFAINGVASSKTTATWAVGSGNGGKLSAAAIANNTTYHWFVIRRPDTGVVDYGFDVSPTVPTLPANYTQFRRIFSAKTDGSAQWVKVIQDGDLFQFATPPALDHNTTNQGTAAVTATLSVPTGIIVTANMNVQLTVGSVSGVYLSDLATTDVSLNASLSPLQQVFSYTNGASTPSSAPVSVRTNTSSQIRTRLSASDANTVLRIATLGWVDTRGRNG